jgi:hypothetical protein
MKDIKRWNFEIWDKLPDPKPPRYLIVGYPRKSAAKKAPGDTLATELVRLGKRVRDPSVSSGDGDAAPLKTTVTDEPPAKRQRLDDDEDDLPRPVAQPTTMYVPSKPPAPTVDDEDDEDSGAPSSESNTEDRAFMVRDDDDSEIPVAAAAVPVETKPTARRRLILEEDNNSSSSSSSSSQVPVALSEDNMEIDELSREMPVLHTADEAKKREEQRAKRRQRDRARRDAKKAEALAQLPPVPVPAAAAVAAATVDDAIQRMNEDFLQCMRRRMDDDEVRVLAYWIEEFGMEQTFRNMETFLDNEMFNRMTAHHLVNIVQTGFRDNTYAYTHFPLFKPFVKLHGIMPKW